MSNGPRQLPPWLINVIEPIHKNFARLARKKTWSIVVVGLLPLILRAAFIPVMGIPEPLWHDEFSYLLAADTFVHGRLTNPTHPMWVHFETFHVLQQPTYTSIYPPAQGMVLALGQILGHPWIGEWLITGLMCSAICWMLQGWLPLVWALYGSVIAMLRVGVLSYWMNGYWSSSIVALGGLLVLGALPRIKKHPRIRDAIIMWLGLTILANSRPFEGLLLAIIVGVALIFWMVSPKSPKFKTIATKFLVPIFVLLFVTVLATGYFYYRVIGTPFHLAYQVDIETYNPVPAFLWQHTNPEPAYRHATLRQFYEQDRRDYYEHRTIRGFLIYSIKRSFEMWAFYLRPVTSIPLLMLPWLWRDRRMRFPLIAGGVFYLVLMTETWSHPHYAAPAMGLLFLIIAQCGRRMALWNWRGYPVGRLIAGTVPLLLFTFLAVRLVGIAMHREKGWPLGNLQRAAIQNKLEKLPQKQLVIVSYAPSHRLDFEWVYNSADIDASKVVWARDMGEQANQELLHYFHDREAWAVVVNDLPRPDLVRYPASAPN